MKLNIYISTLIVSLLATTSCSVIQPITAKKPATETSVQTKEKKAKGTKRGKRNKNTVSAPVETPVTGTKHVFSAADSTALAQQLAGEWYFDNVAGIKVEGEDNRPFLTFDENIPRFYASNGCSYFNGDYKITGFNTVSFDKVISTANYCADIPWADYISALWNVTSAIYVTKHGSEEYLDIRDSNNRSLATLRRHQLSQLNGMWNVVRIENQNLSDNLPTIVIDLIEKTVHGNSGCNLFNGTIYQSPDTDGSVQFQNMAVTRMSCPGVAIETAFLIALEQVEKAIIISDDEAVLTDAAGNKLLWLKRAQL